MKEDITIKIAAIQKDPMEFCKFLDIREMPEHQRILSQMNSFHTASAFALGMGKHPYIRHYVRAMQEKELKKTERKRMELLYG